MPDAIVAHPGWGESMFVKNVWPGAPLGIYAEVFYRSTNSDTHFDPEFPGLGEAGAPYVRLKNLNTLLHFGIADAAISPTQWQASTFPEDFRRRISVIHDGIDTARVAPNPEAVFEVAALGGAGAGAMAGPGARRRRSGSPAVIRW